jgi:hypothetical protein
MSEGSEGPRAARGLEAARGERNLLERLIARIPGFGGFQERELRRDVDKLQREYLSEAVHRVKRRARDAARAYTDAGRIGVLDRFGRLEGRLDRLGESIRFADYGTSGLFAVEKIGEAELQGLYEHDLALLDDLDLLAAKVDELPPPGDGDPAAALDAILGVVADVEAKWSRRETEISRVVQTGR